MTTPATGLHFVTQPALQYHRWSARYLLAPWVPDLVECAQLLSGQRVLDIACGTGVVARVAAERVGPTGTVIGLDLNPEMLRVAQDESADADARIQWQQGDAMALPFGDASFDAVLCQQGLQFFADRVAALRQIRRVLVHGGRLGLAVWSRLERNPYSAALTKVFCRHLGQEIADRARLPFALGDEAELRGLLVQAGFRSVEVAAVIKVLPLPPLFEFIAGHLSAMTLAPVFAAMDASARDVMIGDADRELARYVSETRAQLPFEVLMATAR